MRLTEYQVHQIKRLTAEVFGSGVDLRLFGSRLDDDKKGGDIDLLVTSPNLVPDKLGKSLRLTAKLQMVLGDQPIDVLVLDPTTPINPIYEQALSTGAPL